MIIGTHREKRQPKGVGSLPQSPARGEKVILAKLSFIILKKKENANDLWEETSQELRMLSSVTINCQITKIVMNSGSQLSEL